MRAPKLRPDIQPGNERQVRVAGGDMDGADRHPTRFCQQGNVVGQQPLLELPRRIGSVFGPLDQNSSHSSRMTASSAIETRRIETAASPMGEAETSGTAGP